MSLGKSEARSISNQAWNSISYLGLLSRAAGKGIAGGGRSAGIVFFSFAVSQIAIELFEQYGELRARTFAKGAFRDVSFQVFQFSLRKCALAGFADEPSGVFAGNRIRHFSVSLPMQVKAKAQLHTGSIK